MKIELITGIFFMSFFMMSCSSDASGDSASENASAGVSTEKKEKLQEAQDIQSEALILESEVEEFVESLETE